MIFKQAAGSEATMAQQGEGDLTMAQQGEGDLTMAQVLQALLADRQQRDRELTEERQRRQEEAERRDQERLEEARHREEAAAQRDEERRAEIRQREEAAARREEEVQAEFRRREEESHRREELMRAQMQMLKELITGVQAQGEKAALRLERDRDVKVTKLTEKDDIEAYLTTFERLMKAYDIKEERWSFKLAPQLIGKAQQAYAAMPPDEAKVYANLKDAILRRYDINEESYRQRFRSAVPKPGEINRELRARLGDLAEKWMQKCKTMEEVRDLVVLEQLVNALPEEIRVWVKERKPKTSEEASELADDYVQARKQDKGALGQGSRRTDKKPTSVPRCDTCGKVGHHTRDCWSGAKQVQKQKQQDQKEKASGAPQAGKVKKEVECFNCHQKGHMSYNCPNNAMLCEGAQVKIRKNWSNQEVSRPGKIEGKAVKDILLDTGCSRTLVHKDHVPMGKVLEGEAVAIRCAHGDTVLYPLACVNVEVDGQAFEVQAAVADKLPLAMLLGTDVPILPKLLGENFKTAEYQKIADALVVTRAQARKEWADEEARQRKELECGVQPTAVTEEATEETEEESTQGELDWMQDLDDELIINGRDKVKLTRSQKRENKRQYQDKGGNEDEIPKHALDISAEGLKTLQETDTTLETARAAAEGEPSTAGAGFFKKDGLLYKRWIPPGCNAEEMAVEQLVLPLQCRETVLRLGHEIPLAGHLGKHKTARRILQRFYWPTLYKDVQEYCRTCGPCQKTSQWKDRKAPLIPLPVIGVPFQRIAMDIVGPLPRSRSGNRYILVVCDYATRYPEAVALKSIDAEHIAEELVQLFARVGIPEEILTDQGSNFTSQLLTELYKMLHVHPIRTSPYHPQTDGLVERFNQTLKAMLRKAAVEEGKDWDKMIPYLLFAYREVPQASTGFSPFELLYGRAVHGPLDVLRQTWEADKKTDESVVSHILSIRDKMEKMLEAVQTNLEKAQQKQKKWYDKNARQREFEVGDQVLVLLPTATSKLLAQWQGPYQVRQRVGKVNYQVDMHDRRKRKRIFHINMLRPWRTRSESGYLAQESIDTEFEDVPVWSEASDSEVEKCVFGEQLSEQQHDEFSKLLHRYSSVTKDVPGKTMLVEHHIRTGEARSIRLPPYRIPHAYREVVKEEIDQMLEQGLIEPSASEWSAPIVLVKKKDGSMRLCVDYRRLNGVSETDAYPMGWARQDLSQP